MLEIILIYIFKFKKNYSTNDDGENTDILREKIINFEKLILILINLKPEQLFKEIKNLLLNDFESKTNEIKKCLEKLENEKTSK